MTETLIEQTALNLEMVLEITKRRALDYELERDTRKDLNRAAALLQLTLKTLKA